MSLSYHNFKPEEVSISNNDIWLRNIEYHYQGEENGHIKMERFGAIYGLVQSPVTGRYFLLKNETVRFGDNCIFDMLRSNTSRVLAPVIAKNGCSSILKSFAINDGYGEYYKRQPSEFAWMIMFPERDKDIHTHITSEGFDDYKKFIVYDNEQTRFMRWLNYTRKLTNQKDIYTPYSEGLDDDTFLRELLWLFPYMVADPTRGDQHCLPQMVTIQKAIDVFGKDNIEFVPLKNLGEYFEKDLGIKFYKSNVTKKAKPYHFEELKTEYQDKIKDITSEANDYLRNIGLNID